MADKVLSIDMSSPSEVCLAAWLGFVYLKLQ